MGKGRVSGLVSQSRLRELLCYDVITGLFTWNVSRGKAVAGSVAGKLRDTGRVIGIDGDNYQAARLAWFWVHGEWPARLLRFGDSNRDNTAIGNLSFGVNDFTTQQGKNSYQKKWRDANPRSQRHLILKRGYGMSVEDYAKMLEAHGGVCACCKKPETAIVNGKLLPLCVDHCHNGGGIRGLLCQHCNKMLGHAFDTQDILRAGADYLDGHAAKSKTNVIPLSGRRISK